METRGTLITIILISLLFCVSCSSENKKESNKTSQPQPVPTGKTLVYDCLEASDLVLKVDSSDAWIFLKDTTLHLSKVVSASGVRYMSEDHLYWSKGDEAIIEINNNSYGYCDLDRKEAVWQDAKLRGAEFRAVGNEPGWYLEVFPDSIRYVLDYGERRFTTPSAKPKRQAADSTKSYNIKTKSHSMSIRITDEPCTSPAGKQFPSTTYLTVDSEQYRGCGKQLK